MSITKYSDRDIIDWRIYERVRSRGTYNMFDLRARELTGLSKDRYNYILGNYCGIQDQIEEQKIINNINNNG